MFVARFEANQCLLGLFAHWDRGKALYHLTELQWRSMLSVRSCDHPPGMAVAKPSSMNFGSTAEAVATIVGLRQEINRLIQEHFDALKSASKLRTTPDEASVGEARRKIIRKLAEELWRQRVSIGNFNV